MTPEILALVEHPPSLLAVVGIGVIFGMIAQRLLSQKQRGEWFKNKRKNWKTRLVSTGEAGKPPDAADQLRTVMDADFTPKPLLNKSEVRVFQELDRIVTVLNPAWKVMAQVSLGEMLRSDDYDAYRCVNSKRVDILLIDGDCHPRHAIEYQGGAHHRGTAAARDAVKKEALRRAGVGYHEVVAGHTTPADLKRLVEKLVDKPQ